MSDSMTNAEVEDILSSIRKLVSEDARNEAPKPDPEVKPTDRLVLTPSLRVEKPALETQTDGFELLKPDTTVADDHGDPDAFAEENTAEDAINPDDAHEEEAQGFDQPKTEDIHSAANDAVTQETDERSASPTSRRGSIGWSLMAKATARHAIDAPDVNRAPFAFQPAAKETTPSVEADGVSEDASIDVTDTTTDDRSNRPDIAEFSEAATEEVSDSEEVDNLLLDQVDTPESEAEIADNVAAIVADETGQDEAQKPESPILNLVSDASADDHQDDALWQDELAEDAGDQFPEEDTGFDSENHLDTEEAISAAPFVHVDLEDGAEEDKETLSQKPVPSLGDKIAALETLIARGQQEFEPDEAGESDSAAIEEPVVEWDDVEEQLPEFESEHAKAPEVLEADSETLPEFVAAPRDLDVEEDSVLDENALRELVSDIVREELQGVLGQRITRNVRKLVRREIQRALSAHDLD